MLRAACEAAGRPAGELTRRDVALALLAKPAAEALTELPALRRELLAAGNPQSSTFWASAETVLPAISAGTATVGNVKEWLEATGTEPIQMFPSELFFWPDEDERSSLAAELHALLIAHLELLVADGTIDPDRLAARDAAALAAYRQIQLDWLRAPLPDGRVPADAILDEQMDEYAAEWDDAEREAHHVLGELLKDAGPRPCPEDDLSAACARLRDLLDNDDSEYRLLRAAADVNSASLPADDRQAWLTLAASVVSPQDDVPENLLDRDSQIAWMTLEISDWIAAAVVVARGRPGTDVDQDTLAQQVVTFELDAPDDDGIADDVPDADDEDEWFDDGPVSTDDEALDVSLGLFAAVRIWKLLGAIDQDDRLTRLGWWGLPESVLHAWRPDDEQA